MQDQYKKVGEVGLNICCDDRSELIERYKKQLVESTNIKSSPDEMAVIDNILFRLWQMGWLKEQEAREPIAIKKEMFDEFYGIVSYCPKCDCQWIMYRENDMHYCPECGQKVKWNDSN